MKTNFTRLQRRGTLFFCLVLTSLFLLNCDTQDMETIDPYEFVNDDFDEVKDLEPVEDEDPEITEPETGSVEGSEDTKNIIDDVMAANEDGEVNEETKEKLNQVEEFTEKMPPAVNEKAEALDEAGVDAILDENQEMDADLEEVRNNLKEVPEEVKQLLPKIQLSTDFDGMNTAATTKHSLPSPLDFSDVDFKSQAVTGPCADAANEAYDERITTLTTQRDGNLETVENNYTRRVGEADTRYTTRVTAQQERYAANKADIKGTLTDLLSAAEQATNNGNTALAKQLKQLTLLYAVDARAALEEWNALVLELLEERREEEKAQFLQIRETKTAEINANFNTAEVQAVTVLNNALGNCHNQGAGN